MPHIGNILKQAIESSGLTISDFQRRMKIKSRTTVYRWFDSSDLKISILQKASQVLKYDFSKAVPEMNIHDPEEAYSIVDCIKERDELKNKVIELQNKIIQLQTKQKR